MRQKYLVALRKVCESYFPLNVVLEIVKRGPFRPRGMTLDGIAKKILQELANNPLTSAEIAAACAGGAVRMTSPRLVWLEGLGMVESTGPDTYGITELGLKFLDILG